MELSSWVMLAVEEAAKGAAPNPFSTLWLPIVASIAVVLILNPFGKKEDKKQKQLLESLKKTKPSSFNPQPPTTGYC
jgi:hypothetical protein